MQTNLYIPSKIKVGFQKRGDTFTGKLAFITYADEKGVLRQENAWNGWRDKKIEPIEFDNTPRSNFVFNKDVNRSGHWSDITKVRIYDTRDFEFEIDVSNMMYILMHSDISKRDIAEECVFAWSGRNLVLLPINSEEYRKSIEQTRKINTKFSLKNLVAGHTYMTKHLGEAVYLGYYEWAEQRYMGHAYVYQNVGKKHIFKINQKYHEKFVSFVGSDLVEEISNEIHPHYSNFVEALYKTRNMQNSGKFTVKKGFNGIGYKKLPYEIFKVIISTNKDGHASYSMYSLEFSMNNDKPKITNERPFGRYTGYEEEIKDKKINVKNLQQITQFFIDKGFGDLFYIDKDGIETSI